MTIGDKIRTTAWLRLDSLEDYHYGEIYNIISERCFDGSIFDKILIKLDDGRILPCIKDELELLKK
jgi:hypothetical protein